MFDNDRRKLRTYKETHMWSIYRSRLHDEDDDSRELDKIKIVISADQV